MPTYSFEAAERIAPFFEMRTSSDSSPSEQEEKPEGFQAGEILSFLQEVTEVPIDTRNSHGSERWWLRRVVDDFEDTNARGKGS